VLDRLCGERALAVGGVVSKEPQTARGDLGMHRATARSTPQGNPWPHPVDGPPLHAESKIGQGCIYQPSKPFDN